MYSVFRANEKTVGIVFWFQEKDRITTPINRFPTPRNQKKTVTNSVTAHYSLSITTYFNFLFQPQGSFGAFTSLVTSKDTVNFLLDPAF